jgi:hypothetical protein
MDEDLTAIVAADEEARARVQAARAAADTRVEAARLEIEGDYRARLEALRSAVDREIQDIDNGAARVAADRAAARAAANAVRQRKAEAALPAAAEVYASIVREGAPRREGT